MKRFFRNWLGLWLLMGATFSSTANAAEPDWQLYNQLLKQHVTTGQVDGITLNQVDYSALKQDPRWPRLLSMLESYSLSELETGEEQIAFYINAYNILAIKTVVDNWPLESIKDEGSWLSPVWKRDAGVLDGKTFTLDQIEHKILRKMDEPRIHFAIVCASLSCPDLRAEAYVAEQLDSQLDDQLQQFVANPGKGSVAEGNRVKISKIFDWFEEDFESAGGVLSYLQQNTAILATKLDGYLDYDWRVNGF